MSTTPRPTPRSTSGTTPQSPSGAAPTPSLTERRKAETRMEIARAAAALFVRQGLRATRAEDIAQRAGIAPRTFYRYFATKEEAVAPLYAAGAQRWAEAVRTAPARLTVPQALEHAVEHTLTPGVGVSAASWEWVRTLIRLTDTSPALRKVWAEVGQTSEEALAEILARRLATPGWGVACAEAAGAGGEGAAAGETGGGGTPAREPYEGDPPAGEPYVSWSSGGGSTGGGSIGGGAHASSPSVDEPFVGETFTEEPFTDETVAGERFAGDPLAGESLAGGPGAVGAGEAESVEPPLAVPVITPDLRFAAAVAGSAVRVAVQSWAATASPPAGPDGPAALALRNLKALGGFDWDGAR
ncbi:transcriptional regulator, TetR family [Streptomyces sp. DconLS]|nr:transcriptional regulator, TetR family [Streptomyces sp. DconLS]SCG04199.1 transcriptional regulator, TetR family [Streptomyces sp. LamerLS-31b]